ncbi:adenylate kinase [uncultured Chryseobacterium sp.]|uniref:adenylate kinase n=1 Tax=uncultured Chryseobacterium sp. TaxID=259322 RepID=UPI0025F8B01C|nr:adenylate kinase [uncultured Chryseobacterium sp.]
MKLHIFGASGSGVTTLGHSLGQKLGTAYFDSDDYFWLKSEPPFTMKRDPEERNRMLSRDLDTTGHWILGGSVFRWGDGLLPDFDLVVFLYLPPAARMERLKKREWERYGDLIFTDEQRAAQHQQFIDWAAGYDHATGLTGRNLQAHNDWLKQIQSPVLRIEGTQTVQEREQLIMHKMNELKILVP